MSMETYAGIAMGWIAGGAAMGAWRAYKDGVLPVVVIELIVATVFIGGYYAVLYQ